LSQQVCECVPTDSATKNDTGCVVKVEHAAFAKKPFESGVKNGACQQDVCEHLSAFPAANDYRLRQSTLLALRLWKWL